MGSDVAVHTSVRIGTERVNYTLRFPHEPSLDQVLAAANTTFSMRFGRALLYSADSAAWTLLAEPERRIPDAAQLLLEETATCLHAAFAAAPPDGGGCGGDGGVGLFDFLSLLLRIHVPLSEASARAVFARCDAGSTGSLSLSDLRTLSVLYPVVAESILRCLADAAAAPDVSAEPLMLSPAPATLRAARAAGDAAADRTATRAALEEAAAARAERVRAGEARLRQLRTRLAGAADAARRAEEAFGASADEALVRRKGLAAAEIEHAFACAGASAAKEAFVQTQLVMCGLMRSEKAAAAAATTAAAPARCEGGAAAPDVAQQQPAAAVAAVAAPPALSSRGLLTPLPFSHTSPIASPTESLGSVQKGLCGDYSAQTYAGAPEPRCLDAVPVPLPPPRTPVGAGQGVSVASPRAAAATGGASSSPVQSCTSLEQRRAERWRARRAAAGVEGSGPQSLRKATPGLHRTPFAARCVNTE